jgi:hypothetical protein
MMTSVLASSCAVAPAGEAGAEADTTAENQRPAATALRFEVAPAAGLDARGPGRVVLVLDRATAGEPRLKLGGTDDDGPPSLAVDVAGAVTAESPAVLDETSYVYPLARLADLQPGTYRVQAVLDRSRDIRLADAAGNLVSEPVNLELNPAKGGTVRIELSRALGPDPLPADTDRVRFLEIESPKLSAFHGRPIRVRVGVILPLGFDAGGETRYPLRVHIGGFGTRYTAVSRMMREGSNFRAAWDGADAPRFVLLHLDGAGPLGDPYQVDSANHGPYGASLMEEIIPEVEKRFRCGGSGTRRVLDGGSTGGWVSFALQVFYPDAFAGTWSFCPDPVDFRSYQKINIYEDVNAYKLPDGAERPSRRDPRTGKMALSMAAECGMENLLGAGTSYTMSGQQWGSWNATFAPRGPDGRPAPLWDARTGVIDRAVAAQFRKYDLRAHLEANWPTLGPKLKGKVHIWVGDADDYYLNEGVRRLDAFLSRAEPPYGGSIAYGPGRGHCWIGISEAEMLRQMAAATGAPTP